MLEVGMEGVEDLVDLVGEMVVERWLEEEVVVGSSVGPSIVMSRMCWRMLGGGVFCRVGEVRIKIWVLKK